MSRWIQAQKHEKNYWLSRKELEIPPESMARYSNILELLPEKLDISNKTVLDIGSGPKAGILVLIPSAKSKVALDPLLKKDLRETRPEEIPLVGVAECLPIRDGSFDVVFSINMLDHTSDPYEVLQEIHRVVRGKLIMMVHIVPPKRKAIHAIFHSSYKVRHLLSPLRIAPKFLSYLISSIFKTLGLLINDKVYLIWRDGYAHPFYLTLSDVINSVMRLGFIVEKTKILPDKYGALKLGLYMVAQK